MPFIIHLFDFLFMYMWGKQLFALELFVICWIIWFNPLLYLYSNICCNLNDYCDHFHLFNYAYYFHIIVLCKTLKSWKLSNFTVLRVQFKPRHQSVTVNPALRNEYSYLRFRVRVLICTADFGTVKSEYGGLYSGFTGRRFNGSIRDALISLLSDPLSGLLRS
jgi:hypothetical protein